jgi:hypothetical protein
VTCLVFGAALLALGFSVALCSLDRWPVWYYRGRGLRDNYCCVCLGLAEQWS